jgi:hypothetical protein
LGKDGRLSGEFQEVAPIHVSSLVLPGGWFGFDRDREAIRRQLRLSTAEASSREIEVLCPGIIILFGRYDEAVLLIFKLNHPIIIMQELNGVALRR